MWRGEANVCTLVDPKGVGTTLILDAPLFYVANPYLYIILTLKAHEKMSI